ncbi:hypothetical protein K2173_026332 [Erythroxylum novogranatense]|uniref:YLP motif-containing protein 1 n=1 Tax=Erythroxylum novogranatense TaxID=1862640 RepID=A0AAV8SN06_9ROSI|nr:hypothetical protein K2173_026332 [Erythroxylum novogranatense]
MDRHHHQQWWPLPTHAPPPQANVCSVCSIAHFPFCPPPYLYPPYNHDHSFNTPLEHPRPHPCFSSPFPETPNFGYTGGFGQSMYGYNNNGDNSSHNGYVGEVERYRSYKRPRIDEIPHQSMVSSDDERRLKLIRDHGASQSGRDVGTRINGDMYSPFQPDVAGESQSICYGNQLNEPFQGRNHQHSQSYAVNQFPRSQFESPGRFLDARQPPAPAPPIPVSPPPLPPPPPPPIEPSVQPQSEFKGYSSPPKPSFSLFPVRISSTASNPYLHSNPLQDSLSGEWQIPSMQYLGEGQTNLSKQFSPDKHDIVTAFRLFKLPHRATRPDHMVIILRGLPGSGKSYLAKMMRDLEIENGGSAPRIHSMDDYFMTEVEKVEESDASKSSGSIRGKKPTKKTVMEYCYEPEMEEAYRDSMLKAFKKTLEEGAFTLVIVDDRNLRVADFAQFWAIGKRSGYEVYISEASYKDPAGCAARNVHGFTLDEIQKMADQWEEAPSLYLQLDVRSLFNGDDLKESGIQEVDMDTEDGISDNNVSSLQEIKPEKVIVSPEKDEANYVASEGEKIWGTEAEQHRDQVKDLGKSKWSDDVDEDDIKRSRTLTHGSNALSGLFQVNRKQGKSVRWSDQVGDTGFSIGAVKKTNVLSLVIGPGAGYNLKSNPLLEEESKQLAQSVGKSSMQSIFQEQLRAERESFKAVFDRRKQRIGLGLDEE